ncbi:6-phosphogluconolactonase [Geofilum rubicundum JCM 15548]|uniref:6-phosphogluconolactonase n=2 Tax=Geofilum TaxID=1236988 RepID=A0A0E9LTV1_9BACT|nr:6-phosphogluconolactonase [Geofilum rubicundum JCM 15548]
MRLTFTVSMLLTTLLFACQSPQTPKNQVTFYIGTYTNGSSEGIYKALFDTVTGHISELQLAARLNNPSFLTIYQKEKLLVAVSERDGSQANVFSYEIHPISGELSLLDSVATGGQATCYISMVHKNLVAIANYVSGDVSFIPYSNKGTFESPVTTFKHSGTGPVTDRQEAPHAHSILADPNGSYIYAADLGADKVMVYELDQQEIRAAGTILMTPGAGPRHLAFSPCGQQMALLNELNHTVITFSKDEKGAFTNQTATVQLLPDSLHRGNKSADIHYSPDGRFLYASVRAIDEVTGVDKIEVMDVTDKDSAPLRVGSEESGIHYPRNFSIDPSGQFLLVANKNSHLITVYERDQNTGQLTPIDASLELDSPVCIQFY